MQDRHGNAVSGANGTAVAAYDNAVAAFSLFRDDPVALLDEAIGAAPAFVGARLAKALLLGMATEPAARDTARGVLDDARGLPMNAREASLGAAVTALLDGEWSAAALQLDRHNMAWPHDLLAVQSGHQIDFFRGSARNLRDRIARVLPAWGADMPGRSVLLGMHAFGLEECGDYARAEEAGRRALDADRRDGWAHHAVAHVMEMQGRAEDGIGWMIAREADWAEEASFFRVHNWWHRTLYHLALEQNDAALALYDSRIGNALGGVAVNLVDASALLWRLHLCGVDVGDRWAAVADGWAGVADGALYPFNDWHAVMADLGAGRAIEARLERMRATATGDGEVARWMREIGLPVVTGFAAFWRGAYAEAATALHGVRFVAHAFGGSHAQRDVIDWTLGEAAVRAGFSDVALALAHERLALKPFSPLGHDLLRRSSQAGRRS